MKEERKMPGSAKKVRLKRRVFSEEFKSEAVRQVLEIGSPLARVAREMDLTEAALRKWVEKAQSGASPIMSSGNLSGMERQELEGLRRENRQLKLEREILRKATAFFAKEQM